MAAKSSMDIAIENIDRKIRELERAKEIVIEAAGVTTEQAAPKKRGRKPRKGLPETAGSEA